MSGLFGLINTNQTTEIRQFLDDAGKRMSHQPWHTSDSWRAPGLPMGIGRIGIGIFNHEPQPVASSDGNCLVWLCGELYETRNITPDWNPTYSSRSKSFSEVVLSAYQEFGINFASHMKGVFFIVIYDIAQQKLILTSDRFGLYPHYYYVSPNQLVFAPEVKGVLCAPGIERKLNLTAAIEYIRFQQLIGEKTFHENIFLFPYGSVAEFDILTGKWSVQRYWDWGQISPQTNITFGEAVEEAGNLLQTAVVRLSDGIRPGVFLSGGLDSRTLLGFLPPRKEPPVTATFGYHNSRDVVYAHKIAQAVGSQHYWFDIPDGKWVTENIDLHLKLTEGFHSWVHMHGISVLKDLRPVMDCNLTGWDGGTIMGHPDHVNAIYNHPVDEWSVGLHTYQQFTGAFTWPGLTDAEETRLFTPEYRRLFANRALESLLMEFSRFWNIRQEYAAEYFYLVNHCCRFTHHMVTTFRSALEARFPYWDYDLIDFLYSLPPELRKNQLLFRTIITRRLPRLARIPYDKEEYLPTVQPFLYNLQKMTVRTLKWLKIFPTHPQLYADYENYLRRDLRNWAENILFDPRTTQRGIFNMDFIRSLMNRHLAGHEEWILGKIAPLITFEMVMREYFDK